MSRVRIGDRVTILLLGVALGLAALLALELRGPAPDLATALTRPPEAWPEPADIPLFTPPPLSRYDGILERPLFEKGRTFPEEPPEASAQAAEPAKPPPELKVRLEGVAIAPGESVALLRRTGGGGPAAAPAAQGSELLRVRRGETVDGWKLAEVRPGDVVLRLGERVVELALELPERPASGARGGKPRPPAPRRPPFVLKNVPDRGAASAPELGSPPPIAAAPPEHAREPGGAATDRSRAP